MCAVSEFPPTREVNPSHVLCGLLRRTSLSSPPVAVSRACRSKTSLREILEGPERDARLSRKENGLLKISPDKTAVPETLIPGIIEKYVKK